MPSKRGRLPFIVYQKLDLDDLLILDVIISNIRIPRLARHVSHVKVKMVQLKLFWYSSTLLNFNLKVF